MLRSLIQKQDSFGHGTLFGGSLALLCYALVGVYFAIYVMDAVKVLDRAAWPCAVLSVDSCANVCLCV